LFLYLEITKLFVRARRALFGLGDLERERELLAAERKRLEDALDELLAATRQATSATMLAMESARVAARAGSDAAATLSSLAALVERRLVLLSEDEEDDVEKGQGDRADGAGDAM
jgi:uncharacterized membrane protein YccC